MIKIPCPLTKAAKKCPQHPAIKTADLTITYQDFDRYSIHILERLQCFRFQKNERIAIFLPNSAQYVVLLTALWRMGVVACPVSTRFPTQNLETLLKSIRCQYIVCAPDLPGLPHNRYFKKINIYDLINFRVPLFSKNRQRSFEIDTHHDTTIIFTSGTTGRPKAVLHSFANHYYSAKGSNENIPFTQNDRWLLSLPLYHVGGLGILFRVLLGTGTIVIPPETKNIVQVIKKYKITHASFVPTQVYRLLQIPHNWKVLPQLSLKAVLLGGGPIPESIVKQLSSVKIPLYKTYGLTEMTSQVATTSYADLKESTTKGVKVLPYRELKVSLEGEILVRGETLCKGYIRGHSLHLPFTGDGWFKTGDLGAIDEEGYLTVSGRKDNMFISGGENIHPEEIENIVCHHDAIAQALVVPILHKEYGYRPIVFIKSKQNRRLHIKKLNHYLERYLPRYKIPDVFYPWPEDLERLNFKINRRDLITRMESDWKKFKPFYVRTK